MKKLYKKDTEGKLLYAEYWMEGENKQIIKKLFEGYKFSAEYESNLIKVLKKYE